MDSRVGTLGRSSGTKCGTGALFAATGRPAWDGTANDLSSMKLTSAELAQKLASRRSNNLAIARAELLDRAKRSPASRRRLTAAVLGRLRNANQQNLQDVLAQSSETLALSKRVREQASRPDILVSDQLVPVGRASLDHGSDSDSEPQALNATDKINRIKSFYGKQDGLGGLAKSPKHTPGSKALTARLSAESGSDTDTSHSSIQTASPKTKNDMQLNTRPPNHLQRERMLQAGLTPEMLKSAHRASMDRTIQMVVTTCRELWNRLEEERIAREQLHEQLQQQGNVIKTLTAELLQIQDQQERILGEMNQARAAGLLSRPRPLGTHGGYSSGSLGLGPDYSPSYYRSNTMSRYSYNQPQRSILKQSTSLPATPDDSVPPMSIGKSDYYTTKHAGLLRHPSLPDNILRNPPLGSSTPNPPLSSSTPNPPLSASTPNPPKSSSTSHLPLGISLSNPLSGSSYNLPTGPSASNSVSGSSYNPSIGSYASSSLSVSSSYNPSIGSSTSNPLPGSPYNPPVRASATSPLPGSPYNQPVRASATSPLPGSSSHNPPVRASATSPLPGSSSYNPPVRASATSPLPGSSSYNPPVRASATSPLPGSSSYNPPIGSSTSVPLSGTIGSSDSAPLPGSSSYNPTIGSTASNLTIGSAASDPPIGPSSSLTPSICLPSSTYGSSTSNPTFDSTTSSPSLGSVTSSLSTITPASSISFASTTSAPSFASSTSSTSFVSSMSSPSFVSSTSSPSFGSVSNPSVGSTVSSLPFGSSISDPPLASSPSSSSFGTSAPNPPFTSATSNNSTKVSSHYVGRPNVNGGQSDITTTSESSTTIESSSFKEKETLVASSEALTSNKENQPIVAANYAFENEPGIKICN
ncbi:uncharacterized protein LOC143040698 isoform X2 [Oratosquilla oratoria]|uniref:uncharacterized protein LOC143040698 isoform X2 n=1 Tax=Oratosquilla oratoria TaxID=337810 RepID=UPI003F7665BB